jgi:hypothetical protein
MIVCHCNRIDKDSIECGSRALTLLDPWTLQTPGRVYRALGKTPRCGGCLPLAARIIHECVAVGTGCCVSDEAPYDGGAMSGKDLIDDPCKA